MPNHIESRLMVMEVGTAVATAITPVSDTVTAAYAWAPDGETVAYVSTSRRGVYLVSRDGSNPHLLARTDTLPGAAFLRWSPDGTRLVLGSGFALAVVRADGGGTPTLIDLPNGADFPAWSPDSRTIAFTSQGKLALYVPGAAPRYVTMPSSGAHPDWNPDGGTLAYDDGTAIWIANADGTQPRKVQTQCPPGSACAGMRFSFPHWSPDGLRFVTYVVDGGRVAVMNADGANVRTVAGLSTLSYSHPSWMPDGRVLFLSDRSGTEAPYFMAADTTGAVRITTGAFYDDVVKRVP
jgi:Tol biopolymer transport system component